jgi:hypothetical protein
MPLTKASRSEAQPTPAAEPVDEEPAAGVAAELGVRVG